MLRPLKPYQVVVDLVIAAVFMAVVGPFEAGLVPTTGLEARFGDAAAGLGGLAVVVVFGGALAVRRLSPALSLAIAWAAAALQMGLGRPPSVVDLAIFAVLYATAAYGSRTVYWAGFVSALGGAAVITVYLFLSPLLVGGGLSWQTLSLAFAVLVAAAFALGLSWTVGALVRSALRARESRAARARAEAETAVEHERGRIARDMHDVVAHSLAVVIAQADGARYAAASDPRAAPRALEAISATARDALSDVRLLLAQLRHSQGDGPQPTLADLEGLYTQVRAAGVDLRIDVDPTPHGEPPTAVQLAVFRILQEALTNALRHGAPGGPVDVRLAWHVDRVDLSVRNPLRAGHEPRGSGHGLIGMGERAGLAGGRLQASEDGDGFVVRAHVPIGERS